MKQTKDTRDALKRACELLRQHRTGMLVTRDDQGMMHSRPIIIAEVADDASLSFLTSLGTETIGEVVRAPQVGITLQKDESFVTVSGWSQVIADPGERKRIWEQLGSHGFEGPDDPRASFMSVRPQNLEYWDIHGIDSLKFEFQALTAKAPNDPEPDTKAHGFVEFR